MLDIISLHSWPLIRPGQDMYISAILHKMPTKIVKLLQIVMYAKVGGV